MSMFPQNELTITDTGASASLNGLSARDLMLIELAIKGVGSILEEENRKEMAGLLTRLRAALKRRTESRKAAANASRTPA
jgi:hypothetical protein